MRSRIRRLDDETMPATHSSTDETPEWLPRLTSAVYGWYINNYQYEIPGINQDTSEDGHLVREAFIRQVFEEFIVDSEVHAERIRAKYTGVDIDTALQGLAEAACTKYISNWAKKVLGPEEKSVFGPSSNILLDEAIGPHALAVRQPVGEFVEWAALHDAYRRIEDQDFYQQRQGIKSQPSPSINQIIPLDEQEKLRQEPPYARIEKADFANGATAMRLVLDERRTVNIPELTGNEDIVLRTPSQEAGWLVPAIPGYILVGEDKATGRFGFVRNPEEEPYQECAVLLPVAAIKKLSETYRGIGLDGLANDLVGSEAPTVSDLERLIRDYSTYTEPQVSSTPYRPNLESYVASVTNGYLEVQCTGANSFNVLSLQAAFGTTEAELLKGRVIKQGSMEIASRLGHAQTFFVHNGRQYILDATPTRPDEVDYSYIGTQTLVYMAAVRSLFSRKRSASDLQDRQPVTIPPRQPLQDSSQPLGPAPDKVVEYRLPEPTPEEKITGMLQAAEQQFQTIFNVSDAASLYEQVMKQPESDPARRLLCDFKQWQRQGIPAEQARRTAVYFRNCAADEQVRRQLGLQSYAPDFLLRLAGAADNFAAELERQA
ncbi:MAG TPA: hypothetical protein VK978_01345, partial [Candidatus Saccharimonadales bacterium]|nr:hypothetical protein [Candidatus Saccharimonadales bacterium]